MTELVFATELHAKIDAHTEAGQVNWDSLGISISMLGEECMAKQWLGFRWVMDPEVFNSKTLRIFQSGNIYEERVVAEYESVCEETWDVDPKTGKQFEARLNNGFVRGNADLIARGVPGMPDDEVFAVEIKSHGKSSYNAVLKHGVRKSKPQHYFQLLSYMRRFSLKRGLYACACKDDDRRHSEVIEMDDQALDDALRRAERVIKADTPPPRITTKRDSASCKFCRVAEICWGEKSSQRRSCRTCAYSSVDYSDNRYPVFTCGKYGGKPLDAFDGQKKGCHSHRFIPDLVKFEQTDLIQHEDGDVDVVYEMPDGTTWVDGKGTQPPD